MSRPRRFDAPGLLHHVMNRGIARRTTFETRRDVRYFLALLALEVRARRIEVLAFVILTTHFHLLLRSRTGELACVMQRVTNRYVRYFNRTRKRDGPLFRGRYRAKPVESARYLYVLVRYIDQNAPHARLVSSADRYPWGSAALYASERRPRWLATDYVDRTMGSPTPRDRAVAYARCFGRPLADEERRIVEARLTHAASDDDWDDLVGAAPPKVLAWMLSKARLADGTKPGQPYVSASRVAKLVARERGLYGALAHKSPGVRLPDAWPVLEMGLLRDLAGQTYAEISRRTGCSPNMARRRVEQHANLLRIDEEYARVAARLAGACLEPQ